MAESNKWDKMDSVRPSKFCFFFSLRQGVILVAVTEIAVSGFALILLVLCTERAEEIVMQAVADSTDNQMSLTSLPDWQLFYTQHLHMQRGLKLGSMMLFVLYVALVLTTTHLLTCMLLLYGAVKGLAKLLLPWLCTVMMTIVVSCLFLLMFLFVSYDGCKAQVYIISVVMVTVQLHSWLVVFGYYKEAVNMAAARTANNLLYAYEYEWGAGAVNPLYTPCPTKPLP